MNLPNYFLADLPPEATLSGGMISEACRTLKRNRETYLAGRSTPALVEVLGEIAAGWLQPESRFRKLALEQGPAETGFSRATLMNGLDAFFRQLTPENFGALLVQDLGHRGRLDGFIFVASRRETWQSTSDPGAERTAGTRSRAFGPTGRSAPPGVAAGLASAIARGPELLVHIAAGNIPNPTLTSMVLGVLARSAQFVKCARGSAFLPRLFAHSIYEAEPKLGACLEVAEWRGGNEVLEEALFAEADCVTATGSDETLAAIRRRLPGHVRFLGYGHRVSFGYVAAGALRRSNASRIAARAATDVTAWNQLGCLSPHVIYVERNGAVSPEYFAELLAGELSKREAIEPRGELPGETAAAISSRRAFYEVRAAHSPETRFWKSEGSTAWTVVYESDPRFQLSCLNRFVYVKGVPDLRTTLESADSVRGQVSTVGLAAPEEQAADLATQLAHWGATRICPLGRMQDPRLTWRHDGRPALGDLVTWTEWEQEG